MTEIDGIHYDDKNADINHKRVHHLSDDFQYSQRIESPMMVVEFCRENDQRK